MSRLKKGAYKPPLFLQTARLEPVRYFVPLNSKAIGHPTNNQRELIKIIPWHLRLEYNKKEKKWRGRTFLGLPVYITDVDEVRLYNKLGEKGYLRRYNEATYRKLLIQRSGVRKMLDIHPASSALKRELRDLDIRRDFAERWLIRNGSKILLHVKEDWIGTREDFAIYVNEAVARDAQLPAGERQYDGIKDANKQIYRRFNFPKSWRWSENKAHNYARQVKPKK